MRSLLSSSRILADPVEAGLIFQSAIPMSSSNETGEATNGNQDFGSSSHRQEGKRRSAQLKHTAKPFVPLPNEGALVASAQVNTNTPYVRPTMYERSILGGSKHVGGFWTAGQMGTMGLSQHASRKSKHVLDPQAVYQGTSEELFMCYSQASTRQSMDFHKAMINARSETQCDYVFQVANGLRMIPVVTKQIIPLTLDVLYNHFIVKSNPRLDDLVDTLELMQDGQYIPVTHCQLFVEHPTGILVPTGVYRRPEANDELNTFVLDPDGWIAVRQEAINGLIEMGRKKAEAKKIADAQEAQMQMEMRTFGRNPRN